MSEHLSDFTLDAVAVGAPWPAHLEDCGPCRVRLERLRAHAEQVRALPRFAQVRRQVLAQAALREPPAAPWWRTVWMLVPVLATAAVALVVARGPLARMAAGPAESGTPGLRLKGTPSVELLRLGDGLVNPVLSEGDQVALRLQGAGYRYALVVSVDAGGLVEVLWPSASEWSGELAANSTAPLFQVTEGDFVVHAFYSEAPLGLGEVRDWLATAGSEPSRLSTAAAHAAVALRVEARR
jgi:hypothetical protein